MRLVYQLEQRFIASYGASRPRKELRVEIEVSVGVRNPHVGHSHANSVERPVGNKTNKPDAAIQIEIE